MSLQYDFFISYTQTDEAWAKWVAWQLKEEGYRCVIQVWDFVPGQDFIKEMKEALDSSKKMIAILSEEYFKSNFAQNEMQAAFAANMLLPILVKSCVLPKLFKTTVYINLTDKDVKTARNELIDGAKACLVGSRDGNAIERPAFPGQSTVKFSKAHSQPTKASISVSGKLRVLFLGAEAGTGLDIKNELSVIKSKVAKGKQSKAIRFYPVFDITAEKLFEELNRCSPHVFHFSGRQDAGRILMRTQNGELTTIPDSALAGMFRSLDKGIHLVILDTCYSLQCARDITEVVDSAIGVEGIIYEEEAIWYYSVFYHAIASGRSLLDACGQATAFCQMKGMPKSRIPELRCRRGVSPNDVYLIQHNTHLSSIKR